MGIREWTLVILIDELDPPQRFLRAETMHQDYYVGKERSLRKQKEQWRDVRYVLSLNALCVLSLMGGGSTTRG